MPDKIIKKRTAWLKRAKIKKPANDTSKGWFVYILECRNGKLYTGITNDLTKRFVTHCAGKGAVFTRVNPPSHMIAATSCKGRSEASRLEIKIKKLGQAQKKLLASTWEHREGLPRNATRPEASDLPS